MKVKGTPGVTVWAVGGFTVSQLPPVVVLLVAVTVTAAVVAVTTKAWLDGMVAPEAKVNVGIGLGETLKAPVPPVTPTLSVTGTTNAVPVEGVNVKFPEYVPTASPVGFAVRVILTGVPGATVMGVGVALSHEALLVIATAVVAPEFDKLSVSVAGTVPAGTLLKTTGFGIALRADVPPPVPVRTRFALIMTGGPLLAAMVIVAGYVPAVRLLAPGLTDALMVTGAVPISRSTCSQSAAEFMDTPNWAAPALVVSMMGCDGIDEAAPA